MTTTWRWTRRTTAAARRTLGLSVVRPERSGSLAQGANNQETTQSALQTQITNQRQSVEGVDLSKEMANLISEQQSYQASAKVMNAFSTVMDSLMSVVGQ